MALAHTYVFSESLLMSTSLTVILPQATNAQIGMSGTRTAADPSVLYLLHGLSDDDTIWLRRTSIERYAADYGIAVVMPRVERSFYQDMAHGERYWTYVSEELPAIVQQLFRVSSRREDTFVAGLSMGGYGAMRLGLARPDRFAAAASLSGALDIAHPFVRDAREDFYTNAFGEADVQGTGADLLHLLREADPAALPALMVACGTEDDLWPMQESFLAVAAERGIDVTTSFGPGQHEWGYWDARIQDVLAWLPLAGADRGPGTAPGTASA
ncbi:MAG TPA: esterase [Micrococcales bacterium]|uniref:Esterase family protein n=1 Tax=Miniimonas arenae TaxID=676201 RepID=A0A5C5BFP0_9MICO|nr:alpha/beta hydrolase family protein [Miniimonas arenae]TNU77227.1 esterase family protein [Miniimonas arenae]HCX84543.1 esterase [Micrococcales bacterium]